MFAAHGHLEYRHYPAYSSTSIFFPSPVTGVDLGMPRRLIVGVIEAMPSMVFDGIIMCLMPDRPCCGFVMSLFDLEPDVELVLVFEFMVNPCAVSNPCPCSYSCLSASLISFLLEFLSSCSSLFYELPCSNTFL